MYKSISDYKEKILTHLQDKYRFEIKCNVLQHDFRDMEIKFQLFCPLSNRSFYIIVDHRMIGCIEFERINEVIDIEVRKSMMNMAESIWVKSKT